MLLVLFAASAGVIWIAGVKLSDNTDVLAERLHLGSGVPPTFRTAEPIGSAPERTYHCGQEVSKVFP